MQTKEFQVYVVPLHVARSMIQRINLNSKVQEVVNDLSNMITRHDFIVFMESNDYAILKQDLGDDILPALHHRRLTEVEQTWVERLKDLLISNGHNISNYDEYDHSIVKHLAMVLGSGEIIFCESNSITDVVAGFHGARIKFATSK